MGTNKRTYRGRAIAWGLGESGTGKEQVCVEFKVLTEGAPEQSLSWYGYFTEATFDRTVESLRYMGWKGEDLSELVHPAGGLDANEVDLVVEDEEYQGKTYAKVQWVNRVGGLALKAPLSTEKAKAFGAQMRDRVRALSATSGPRPAATKPTNGSAAPTAPPEPPPFTDADVPF